MKVIFERVEDGNNAVLEREDGSTYVVKRKTLPFAANLGDTLKQNADGSYHILKGETGKRKESVEKLLDVLWDVSEE